MSDLGEKVSLMDTLEDNVNKTSVPPSGISVLQHQDRLTIRGSIHYEHYGDPSHSVPYSHSLFTKTQEQPYTRRVNIGTDWVPLDLGWFASKPETIGIIYLCNIEGTINELITPTQEAQDDIAKRVLLIEITGVPFKLKPGMPFFAELESPENIRLRCLHDKARCIIHIFPN